MGSQSILVLSAYDQGREAHQAGMKVDDCPYKGNEEILSTRKPRYDWMMGWYDEFHAVKFPILSRGKATKGRG